MILARARCGEADRTELRPGRGEAELAAVRGGGAGCGAGVGRRAELLSGSEEAEAVWGGG